MGELTPDQAERVKDHLALCEDCRRKFDDISLVVRQLSTDETEGLSEIEKLRLENKVLRRLTLPVTGERGAGPYLFRQLWRVAAVAAVLVVGYFSYPVLSPERKEQSEGGRPTVSTMVSAGDVQLSGSMRLSGQGLRVIARGKKVLGDI
jgi:predicted anti-sigma-YlaC factor YlaD